jgi:hypothetical protein
MGRVKLGNPNAQRNNNARKMEKISEISKHGSYAEREAMKIENNQTKR